MTGSIGIVWLRRELRLDDNPALSQAVNECDQVIVLYILDDSGPFALGAASKWWLHHSLTDLKRAIEARGGQLTLRRGDSATILKQLVSETDNPRVYWNRRYDPYGIEVDTELKAFLEAAGVPTFSFNGALLREPWELTTKAGSFFKVFTPFWRTLKETGPARTALPAPSKIESPSSNSDDLDYWGLLPRRPNWAREFPNYWSPGEAGASDRLDAFLERAATGYSDNRNRPDMEGTSGLSPHLAFGEISPLRIWDESFAAMERGQASNDGIFVFLSEIAWREFSYNLLFHYPEIHCRPIKDQFESFDWIDDDENFRRWTRGETGVPIVDAGMRQLWRTGWMHNRVRMIVASFLTKNLLIHWTRGERWFWDTLVDADPASNSASWQWVAGSGADAAPYFRIFNPITQSQKFDPNGDYIRKFVPELNAFPARHVHAPHSAPALALKAEGVDTPASYPAPIVDLGFSRKRALERYNDMRKS